MSTTLGTQLAALGEAVDPAPTMSKGGIVVKMAAYAGHVALERRRKSVATMLHEIPSGPSALTKEWLTAALCRQNPGARVTGFDVAGGSAGTTSRELLEIHHNEAGQAAGLPSTVFSKATPTWTSRLVCGLTGAAMSECRFYMEVRPELDVSGPIAYHAAADPASGRSIILLEDVPRTRGARFGNPLELYVDRPMAETMMQEMAVYHAAFWNSPRLDDDLRWAKPTLQFQVDLNATINFEKRTMVGFDRARDVMPKALWHRRSELYPATMASLRLNSRTPMTLLHADVHPGNWLLNGDGRMALFDWQNIQTGQWALDVSYALGAGLTVEDRRAWEKELLELYLDELRARGVDAPSFPDAWLQYRQQIFHGLVYWLYTLGAGRMQPDMQPRDITLVDCERLTRFVDDHRSIDALNEGGQCERGAGTLRPPRATARRCC